MPRRRVVAKREVLPDPKYGNTTLAKFMNHVMISGKKSVAESIVYGALDLVQERSQRDPIEVFDEALENIAPMVEVKVAPRWWCYLPGTRRSASCPSCSAVYALARGLRA